MTFKEQKERISILDEFGALDDKVRAFKKTKDRHEQLKLVIAAWHDTDDALSNFQDEGNLYSVTVGPRSLVRTINSMKTVKDLLGLPAFLKGCTFALGVLEKLLPGKVADLTSEARSGSRRVSAVRKLTPGEISEARAA